jgi:diguanylate cyclase (GGDEF)-like protein/PAS domain S-box-containing protein
MKIGLKTLLNLALLASILLPASIIVLMGVSATNLQYTRATANEVSVVSYGQSSGLEVILAHCKSNLWSLKRMEEIEQTASGNYNDVRDTVSELFSVFKSADKHLLNIIITDYNGVIRIDSFGNAGMLFPDIEYARRLSRNETFLSDITINDENYNGAHTFYVLGRVDTYDGLAGFVCVVYSVDVFTNYLRNCGFFEYGDLFVTDRKGSALGLAGNYVTRLNEIESAPLRDIVGNAIGLQRNLGARSEAINSNAYVGSYGQVGSGSGHWFWFGTYPTDQIITFPLPIIVLVFMVGVSVIVCLLFMFAIIRKVTVPLNEMLIKIRRVNEGDMHERFDEAATGEYAYIAEAFNEMMNEVLMGGEMHRAISELSDNILFEWDYKRESLYVSDNFLAMFDIDPARATLMNGRFIDFLMEKDDTERFKMDMNKLFRSKGVLNGEYQVTTKLGSVIWISVRAHCVLDRQDELLRIIGVITNINTEKLLSLKLSEKASYDFLSGLYNRNTFMRQLQSEIERSINSRVGLIFIDVDDFKMINDTYGHDTGDEIIKCVADIIKDALGNEGFAGRFGGDEFVMCVTGENMLNQIGEGLSRTVLDHFDRGYRSEKHDITLKIKASLGIAIAPEHGRDNEALLAAADEAMYFVKKNGKCNYHIFDPKESVLTELNSI